MGQKNIQPDDLKLRGFVKIFADFVQEKAGYVWSVMFGWGKTVLGCGSSSSRKLCWHAVCSDCVLIV